MYDNVIDGTTATVRATKYANGKNRKSQKTFAEQ